MICGPKSVRRICATRLGLGATSWTASTGWFAPLATSLVALAMLGGAAGCEKGDASDGSPESESSRQKRIDDLRSLPYAGTAPLGDEESGGVVLFDASRSQPGYTLIGLQMLSEAHLIDEQGRLIHKWTHAPSKRWEACELLPDGDLLVIGAEESYKPDGTPYGPQISDDARYVLRLGWCGELKWKRKLTAHHDIELTPDGKLLVLTFTRRLIPPIDKTLDTRDDHLTLMTTNGEVIANYSMLEAVAANPDIFPLKSVSPTSLGGEPWVDVFHANSIEWIHRPDLVGTHPIFDPGNILVCFRHQDCVAVFNWQDRKFTWRWGEHVLEGPHDAQTLDNGHILLFDNGLVRNWSRVVEMDPVSGRIVWQYRGDPPRSFLTLTKGSVQRMANGNTLIAESDRGRAFEITPDGEIVWEYYTEPVAKYERPTIIRIQRFPRAMIDAIMAKHDCEK